MAVAFCTAHPRALPFVLASLRWSGGLVRLPCVFLLISVLYRYMIRGMPAHLTVDQLLRAAESIAAGRTPHLPHVLDCATWLTGPRAGLPQPAGRRAGGRSQTKESCA